MENYLLGNQLEADIKPERLDDFGQMISFPFANDSVLISQEATPYTIPENKHYEDLKVNTQSNLSSQRTSIKKNIAIGNKKSNSSVKNIK